MTTEVVLSVDFERWKRRHPWACQTCGALTRDPYTHAGWHASSTGLTPRQPRNPGRGEVWPEELRVHIDASGSPLR